jgi:hypothetical protein
MYGQNVSMIASTFPRHQPGHPDSAGPRKVATASRRAKYRQRARGGRARRTTAEGGEHDVREDEHWCASFAPEPEVHEGCASADVTVMLKRT